MSEWETIFSSAFEKVKQDIMQYHRREDLEEMTPQERALVTGISKLPFPVEIISIQVDNQKYPYLKDGISQLVVYRLAGLGKFQVDYHGEISPTKEAVTNALMNFFKISEKDAMSIANVLTEKFEYTGFSIDDDTHIQFTRYDIRNNQEQFFKDLRSFFYSSVNDHLVNKFMTEVNVDYNTMFNLENTPILESSEFLQPDSRTSHLSLEWLQSRMSVIQLIPNVPESVRLQFQRAKDLFIFGYFRYEFFTISSHYAVLAHETAMKQRYVQSLGEKATITYNSEKYEITQPTYFQISEFIYNLKKSKRIQSARSILVNGEKFPSTVNQVINWLVSKGIIKKWKARMDDLVRKVRNSLSHPEHVQIFMPNMAEGMIRQIVYDINELFASTVANSELK